MSEANVGLEQDPWDTLAGQTIPAPPEPEELPVDAWCLGQIVQTGGAVAKYKTIEYTDKNTGEPASFNQFSVGVRVVGGDGKIKPNHVGRLAFFEANVTPHPEQAAKGAVLDGKLQGFLNAVLACGVAEGEKDGATRANARYQQVLKRTRTLFQEQGYNSGQFNGDKALMIAGCAAKLLELEGGLVLFKTKAGRTYQKGGETKQAPTAVGQVEDYLQSNLDKRKVTVLGEDIPAPGTVGGPVTEF